MAVLRIVFLTVVATGSGAMLGALMGGIHPFGGLTMMPLTLLASLCLLLPAYLWSRRLKRMTRARSYLAVLASGTFGGFAVLVVVFGVLGRLADDFSGETMRLLPIGLAFGGATAICWVVAHHLTASTRRVTEER